MLIGAALLAILTVAPAGALAQPAMPRFGGPPPMFVLLRNAHLSAQQKAQVHKILEANRKDVSPLFEQLHSIHEQIAANLLGPANVSASDFTALEKRLAAIQQQINEDMVKTGLQVRGLLTPAQLSAAAQTNKKLESLHQQIRALLQPSPDFPVEN